MKYSSKLIAFGLSVASLSVPMMTAIPTMAETYTGTSYAQNLKLAMAGINGRRDVLPLKDSGDYNLWKKDFRTQKIFVSYARNGKVQDSSYKPNELGYSYINQDVDSVVNEYSKSLPQNDAKHTATQFAHAYAKAQAVGGVVSIRETPTSISVTITIGPTNIWTYKSAN